MQESASEKPKHEQPKATVSDGPKKAMLKSFMQKLLLLVCSIFVALLLAEGAVRLMRPGFPGFSIPQVEHRRIEGLGFEMIPNQSAYTFASPAKINAYGCRGPEIRDARSEGDVRVLCLGDSITFGVCVADDETYPSVIQSLLSVRVEDVRPEVINCAVQRYATYQEIDWLKMRGLSLSPDIVVLGVYSNDLEIRRDKSMEVEYEREREQAASAFRKRFPWAYHILKNSALVELLKQSLLAGTPSESDVRMYSGKANEQDNEKWNSMRKELEEFRDLAREHDFKPIVLTIPSRMQVAGEYPDSLYPARILEMCGELGLPTVDVLADFRASLAEGTDPYLPWDNHLSAVGHQLVANRMADSIQPLLKPDATHDVSDEE